MLPSNLCSSLHDVAVHRDRYTRFLYKIKTRTRVHRLHKRQKDYRKIKWYDRSRYLDFKSLTYECERPTLSDCMFYNYDNDDED